MGLNVYHYDEVIEEGKKHNDIKFKEPTADTIHMFCYTSGTTGDPKAAMLPHSAFVAGLQVVNYFKTNFNHEDVSISYLPYAHVFEQCVFVYSLFLGFSHGFYDGNPFKLLEDIKEL